MDQTHVSHIQIIFYQRPGGFIHITLHIKNMLLLELKPFDFEREEMVFINWMDCNIY